MSKRSSPGYNSPALTTVSVPAPEPGHLAVAQMIGRLATALAGERPEDEFTRRDRP